MEREIKEFVTKNGNKVEFKISLTGREMDDWRNLFLDYFKSDFKGKIEDVKIEGRLLAEMEKKAIEIAVCSVDGKKEKVLDTILDLPVADYREITDEALKIVGETAEFFASKKKE